MTDHDARIAAALVGSALEVHRLRTELVRIGNPNHDSEGKFTSAGGAGGKAARRKRRRRRKLEALRAKYKGEARDLKARHRGERRELRRDHKAQIKGQKADHAGERRGLVRDQEREHAGLARDHARELRREKDPAEHPFIVESHTQAVAELKEEHGRERRDMLEAHAAERNSLKADHKEDRMSMADDHRQERRELVESLRGELDDAGFKRKGAARAGRTDILVRRLSPYRTTKASSAESIIRVCLARRGWTRAFRVGELSGAQHLELLDDVREYGRSWLHHEAEALFRHHGRSIDAGFDDRGVCDPGHILARSGVQSGLACDRGEDQQGQFADESGASGDVLGQVAGLRSIGSAARHHVGRFFDRARGFVRELIVAGAMALGGPDPLTAADLRAIDSEVAVQHEFFARFHAEVVDNPPVELQEPGVPSGEALTSPMTAAQFAARAESYGNSGWSGAQNALRARTQPNGTMERRVHTRREPHAECATCIEQAAMGWQPIGLLLPIGDSICMGSCDCAFQRLGPDGVIRWLNGKVAA